MILTLDGLFEHEDNGDAAFFKLACGVDVTELRSFDWMTFDFGEAGLLTFFFRLCDSDGESDVVLLRAPSDVLPFFDKEEIDNEKENMESQSIIYINLRSIFTLK